MENIFFKFGVSFYTYLKSIKYKVDLRDILYNICVRDYTLTFMVKYYKE